MGHHIDDQGRFQSDKHPDLPPDRIRINLANPRSERGLRAIAEDYSRGEGADPELANDLHDRLDVLHGERNDKVAKVEQALKLLNGLVLKGDGHSPKTFAATAEAMRIVEDWKLDGGKE